jgi:HEAT repeat protein
VSLPGTGYRPAQSSGPPALRLRCAGQPSLTAARNGGAPVAAKVRGSILMDDVSAVRDLGHPDKNVRVAAAVRLGALGNEDAVASLVGALRTDPDFFVCETVTWALVRCGSVAVGPVITLLGDGPVLARARAAHALSKLGDARAVPALIDRLTDHELAVREKCVLALGQLGGDKAMNALAALLGDHQPELATAVSRALESFGEQALPALVARIGDRDPQVRAQVVDLLGFTGSANAVPHLCGAAEDEHPSVRIRVLTALAALRKHGREQIAAVFARAVLDPDRRVQVLAERLASG